MATHGDVWLPIDPSNPESPMLYCEAWSDGYLSGVGYGACCSSSRIDDVSKLSALFVGSPFFFDPASNTFDAKEGDYLVESIVDACGDDDDAETVAGMVQDALDLATSGDVAGALASKLGQMSLAEKMSKNWGCNVMVRDLASAWSQFSNGAETLDGAAAAKALVDADTESDGLENQNAYFWRDGQFWATGPLGDREVCVPLIQACALAREDGTYGDFPSYLANATGKDQANLLAMVSELRSRGLPIDDLFDGNCAGAITAMTERIDLESSTGHASSASPRAKSI